MRNGHARTRLLRRARMADAPGRAIVVCAGSTARTRTASLRGRNHPRIRGEHENGSRR